MPDSAFSGPACFLFKTSIVRKACDTRFPPKGSTSAAAVKMCYTSRCSFLIDLQERQNRRHRRNTGETQETHYRRYVTGDTQKSQENIL